LTCPDSRWIRDAEIHAPPACLLMRRGQRPDTGALIVAFGRFRAGV
jgi:hypothetical protein